MTTKKYSRADKIKVIVAVLGLVGIILAAVIGALPNFIDLIESKNSPTPITYNTYDDPMEVFSIDYPSAYFLAGRRITTTDWYLGFVSADFKDKSSLIQVSLGKDTSDASIQAANLIERVTNQGMKDILNNQDPKTLLLSNQKTINGYRIHYQEDINGQPIQYYVLIDSAPGLSAMVMIGVGPDDIPKLTESEIEHVLSSFRWLPSKASQYFQ